jgi:hypothetical protein
MTAFASPTISSESCFSQTPNLKKKKVLVSFLMKKGNQIKAPISMNRNNEEKTVKA